MTRYVDPEINQPGPGHPLIVGRDPGTSEMAEGRPFVGQAGTLLFGGWDIVSGKWIPGAVAKAGLRRQDFNITNRVLTQPAGNDFSKHDHRDVEDGRVQLLKLIDELKPSYIIATGAQAAYDLVPNYPTLTDRHPGEFSGGSSIYGAKEILDRRGFFWQHDLPAGPILTTLHPAACLYQAMPNRLLLETDFARLGAHRTGDLVYRPWPTPIRIYNKRDMDAIWASRLVAYDVETKWGGDTLLCIAFYTAEGQAFLAFADALGACSDWLRSDRPKLGHNSQFDRYFLDAKCGVPVGGRHEDTIVGHWACYPEIAGKSDTGREDQKKKKAFEMTRKGLCFLASFHLCVDWWKVYTSDPVRMGQLCANDVAATMWNWEVIGSEVDAMGVRTQYERQIAKLPALIRIQKRGFKVDEDMRQRRKAELSGRQTRLEAQSRAAAEAFIIANNLTHDASGKEHLWYHAGSCPCCHGGKAKAKHCENCANVRGSGAGGSIKRTDLVLALWRLGHDKGALDGLKKPGLVALLPPCKTCNGAGKIPQWDFNPMSGQQMATLLWTYLDVPKYCYSGKKPDATDETLQKALEWAEDQ